MERLRNADLGGLLSALREIYALVGLDDFPAGVLAALRRVVPATYSNYTEVAATWDFPLQVFDPADVTFPGGRQVLSQHLRDNPLFTNRPRNPDGLAHKISDYVSRREFHRLGWYNEIYRPIGIEHDISVTIPREPEISFAPPWSTPPILSLTFSRDRSDFTERERLLLNLLRPHLFQAHRNARVQQQLRQAAAGRGILALDRSNRVRFATDAALVWINAYFPGAPRSGDLPDEVARWVRRQVALLDGEDAPVSPAPLVVDREGRRLVVRLLHRERAGERSLLLEEGQRVNLTEATLAPLGISRREAEVFLRVIRGMTNREIADQLVVSPRTVEKHLEHVYAKLGVESRHGAISRAYALLRSL
jgi:DNA-binding CsgD family transcriptional regulator